MMPPKSSDQVVLERRLRPIYDAIDSNNNKKAIQEAEKVLKKHPMTHCAKALKALALIRSDRVSDAWPLIEEVEAEMDDLDDNTVQAICHCYKDAYTPERICSLFERICASQPKNEHNLTQLFMSYVRIRNYKLQQKTALSLYKEFSRNPYYFWGVMSVVMQALSSDPKLAQTMYYPLAEKMIRKMVDSKSVQAEAECDLYASVLEQSKKYGEAANFLENDPLCQRFNQQPKNLLLYRILHLQLLAQDYLIVVDKCMEAIDDIPDDWHLWETLFNATFQHMNSETCSREEKELLAGRLIEKVLSVINSNAVFDGERRIRGPYLARFALMEKLLENGLVSRAELTTHPLGDPMKLLVEYVQMFYSLPCCFCDISAFVTLLQGQQIEKFLEKVAQLVSSARKKHSCFENGTDKPKTPEPVKWADIVYHRLRRAVGNYDKLPPENKRSAASQLAKLVDASSDSSLAASAYAQLAAYLLWDCYTKHGDVSALYEMILFLESFLSANTDYSCRLMLCRAYALIGAVGQVQRLLQSLDIKYVQRDTLGYLLFGLLEQYGRYNAAIIFYTELTLFFDQSEKEVSESIVTAYKNGSFLQIPRLVEFLDAINQSLIATGADIENRALSACFAVDKMEQVIETLYGDEEAVDFGAVKDNRDLFAIVSFEGGNYKKVIEEEKQKSYEEQVDWMRLKHLLLKCVAVIGMPDVTLTKFSTHLSEFRKHHEYCKQKYGQNVKPCGLMQAPPPVFLKEILNGWHLELMDLLFSSGSNLLELLNDPNGPQLSSSGGVPSQRTFPEVGAVAELVAKIVSCSESWKNRLSLHLLIRHCSRVVQTLALASITVKLLEMVAEKVYVNSAKPKKGSRKSPGGSCFAKLNECLRKGAQDIDNVLVEGQNALSRPESIFPEVGSDSGKEMFGYLMQQKSCVDDAIVDCYRSSISDMRKFVTRILKSPYS